MVQAIAFKANNKENRYLADGIDFVDWEDEYGDVEGLDYALLLIRKDLTTPDQKDVDDFYKFTATLPMSNDVQFIKDNYQWAIIEITPEQLAANRERNEW